MLTCLFTYIRCNVIVEMTDTKIIDRDADSPFDRLH